MQLAQLHPAWALVGATRGREYEGTTAALEDDKDEEGGSTAEPEGPYGVLQIEQLVEPILFANVQTSHAHVSRCVVGCEEGAETDFTVGGSIFGADAGAGAGAGAGEGRDRTPRHTSQVFREISLL